MAKKTLRFQTSVPAFVYGGTAYVRVNGGPVKKAVFDGINWEVDANDGDVVECWFRPHDEKGNEVHKSKSMTVTVGEVTKFSPPILIGEV